MTPDRREIEALLNDHLAPGRCSAAAVRDGRLLCFWHAPRQPLLPIYSITKTYIATLVLLAVRAGRLDLNEDVSGHCPDLPDAGRISLRQLLNHTAGLRDYGPLPEYHQAIAGGAPVWSDEEFATRTYRRGGLFAPGAGWSYANPGYALLVRILEATWRQPLAQQLRERVCQPLTLARTRLADSLDHPDICPASSPLLSPAGNPRPVKSNYPAGWVWHRLIVSDAADTARFLDALLRGHWLGDTLTNAMMELVPVGGDHPPWTEPGYGLGLMGEPRGPRGPLYGHNGGGPGYSASAYHVLETGTTVTVIAATEDADAVLAAAFALHDRVTAADPASAPTAP